MIKKFAIVLFIMATLMAMYSAPIVFAGGVQCQTYQCHQAQQEIQYLYDAIWRESEKRYPNYAAMNQAQERINWLENIR